MTLSDLERRDARGTIFFLADLRTYALTVRSTELLQENVRQTRIANLMT